MSERTVGNRLGRIVGRIAGRLVAGVALACFSLSAHATTLYDLNGFAYDIYDGGYMSNGTRDAYDGAYYLRVGGTTHYGALSGQSADGRELYTTAETEPASGLTMERRIYVPSQGNFARYTEILTNPSSADITVEVELYSNLGSDGGTTTLVDGGHYLITDDSVDGYGGYDPTLVHYHSPSSSTLPASHAFGGSADSLSWGWSSVTVPAFSTVRLLSFVSQTQDAAAAQQVAQQITANGIELYENMTDSEQAEVLNFTPPSSSGGSGGGLSGAQALTIPTELTGQTLTSSDGFSLTRTASYADLYSVNLAAGAQVTISMSSSFDTYLYLYDSTGARVASDDDGGDGYNSRIQFTASITGVYFIEATTYGSGVTGTYALDVVGAAVNQPPQAAFNFTATSYDAPADVSFIDLSSDPEGLIYSRCWDFGDGSAISCTTDTSVSHTFAVAGNYSVRLIVYDDQGASGESSQTVTIQAPAAVGEATIVVGDSITAALELTDGVSLTRGSSYADLYRIDLTAGDEVTIDLTSAFDTYLFLYDVAHFQLRANDDGGDGLNSRIQFTAPYTGSFLIEATSYSGGVTGSYNLSVVSSSSSTLVTTVDIDVTPSASNPLSQTLLARLPVGVTATATRWTLGDGGTVDLIGSSGVSYTYVYGAQGTYQVSVSIAADDGNTYTGAVSVTVSDATVTAGFAAASLTGEAPFSATFIDTSSSSLIGDVLEYEWSFGDGQYSTEQSPTYEYTTAGVYDVMLTVTSVITNQQDSYTAQVTVTDPAATTTDVTVTGLVRLRPQVVMAGFDPILIDLSDTSFKVFAVARPGAVPIEYVRVDQNEGLMGYAMSHVATYSNGDQRHEATLTFARGAFSRGPFAAGVLSNLFGDQPGEFNISVVDQQSQEHTFPDLELGNFVELPFDITSPYLPPTTQPGIRRLNPQVLGAGFDPALVDYLNDTSFQVRALVREGVVPIQTVSIDRNSRAGFSYGMDLHETLPNGDKEYRVTYTFARGFFPTPRVMGFLFGDQPGEFKVQVTDQAQLNHAFPDLRFGNYQPQ